jgi:general secretion pathway protein A
MSVLGPPIKVIPIFQPLQTFDEMVEFILRELKVPLGEGKSGSRLRQLDEYLYQRSAQDESLLIIVDEAQNLSGEFLEQLRLLCNPDPVRPRFVQGFLVAEPDIDEKLDSYDLRALKQRIVIRRKLRPLTEEESREYIDHRLRKAGSSLEEIFTPEAAALICRHSGGIPRVINTHCYFALSTGYVLSQKRIDAPVIEKILPLFGKQQPGIPEPRQSPAMAFIDRFAKSAPMVRISYALLTYSLVIWLAFFLINLK